VPSRAWLFAKIAWFTVIAAMAVWTLAISADMLFLTPFAITILFGGGFIFDRASEPIRCSYCRLAIDAAAPRGDAPVRGAGSNPSR
jgi:hypothetical protein